MKTVITAVSLVLALSFTVTGCKKDGAPAAGAEGAAKSSKEKFVGTWQLDAEKTIESDPKVKEMVAGEMGPKIREMMAAMKMEITANTVERTGGPGGKVEKLTYKVTAETASAVTVESTDEKGKVETRTFEFEGDGMKSTDEGKSLHFKRAK